MTGEKIADHILGRRLPPENLVPWVHPDWQTRQR
jgi:choline dehydrogenase